MLRFFDREGASIKPRNSKEPSIAERSTAVVQLANSNFNDPYLRS